MIPRTLLAGCMGAGVTLLTQPVTKADCIGKDKLISMELQKLKAKKCVPELAVWE
jgi:hypothetical protein